MTKSKHFPELNIETLTKKAHKWAENYPCIEQIDLYRPGYDFQENVDDFQPKYMFVVTVPSTPYFNGQKDGRPYMALMYKKIDKGIGINYLSRYETSFEDIEGDLKIKMDQFSVNRFCDVEKYLDSYAAEAANEYPEFESILRYYDWVQNDGMRGDCDHIGKYIPDFYNVRPKYSKIRDHWIWFSITPQENILEFNEGDDDFIKVGEKEILFKTKIIPREKKKREMLQIAVEVWENYPDLLIKNMIKHPEIQNANKTTPGSPYSEKTLHGFLSEKAPQSVKKHKRPSKETQRRQAEICKELNIPL